jgi:hypothetical protein
VKGRPRLAVLEATALEGTQERRQFPAIRKGERGSQNVAVPTSTALAPADRKARRSGAGRVQGPIRLLDDGAVLARNVAGFLLAVPPEHQFLKDHLPANPQGTALYGTNHNPSPATRAVRRRLPVFHSATRCTITLVKV